VPRLISVSVTAAILAIAISLALALAGTLNNGQSGGNPGTPARHSTPALTSRLQTSAPRWASNPFADLLSRLLPQPWLSARP
jgi:hypothetical protein